MSFCRKYCFAILWSIGSCAISANAGDNVQFDPQAKIHEQQLDEMKLNLETCLQNASKAMLMQGVRSRKAILSFSEGTCGPPFRSFPISIKLATKAQADAWVVVEANKQLDAVLAKG